MSSTSVMDRELLTELPRPVAHFWREAVNADSPSEAARHALTAWELAVRLQVAWGLAGYAGSMERSADLEALFRPGGSVDLERISLGAWVTRLFALAKWQERSGSQRLRGAFAWLIGPSRALDSDTKKRIDDLTSMRNRFSHSSRVPSAPLGDALARGILGQTRGALHSARVLRTHRMVVTRRGNMHRSGTITGDIDVLVSERVWQRAEWPNGLPDVGTLEGPLVFLVPPDGRYLLDLDPFVAMGRPSGETSSGDGEDMWVLDGFRNRDGTPQLRSCIDGALRHATWPGAAAAQGREGWLYRIMSDTRARVVDNPMPHMALQLASDPTRTSRQTFCDRYEVLEELGRGATATVYRVRCRQLGREFALKVLHPALSADRELGARLRREGELLRRIQHPNVIAGMEVDRDPASGCLVLRMEAHGGGTLRDLIRRGPTAEGDVLAIAKQGLAALGVVHSNNVVHRDVKPANFLIADDGGVVLADLGVAKDIDVAGTRTGVVMGTIAYLPPEAHRGSSHLTAAADVYAFGKVLTELLVGEELDATYRPGEGIASGLSVLLTQMGNRDPARRPSAREAYDWLEAYASRTATLTPPRLPAGPAEPNKPVSIPELPAPLPMRQPSPAREKLAALLGKVPGWWGGPAREQAPQVMDHDQAQRLAAPSRVGLHVQADASPAPAIVTPAATGHTTAHLGGAGSSRALNQMTAEKALRVAQTFLSVPAPYRQPFADAMVRAAHLAERYCHGQWAATNKGAPRIHVAGLHMITVQEGVLWLALDEAFVVRNEAIRACLAASAGWLICPEDPHYVRNLRSVNGSILSSPQGIAALGTIWPAFESGVRQLNGKNKQARIIHDHELAAALEQIAGRSMPR